MANAMIKLEALFRTTDGTDVVTRTHEIDVTDTRNELLDGCDEWAAVRVDEDLIEGAACRIGWDADPLFIEWIAARVIVA